MGNSPHFSKFVLTVISCALTITRQHFLPSLGVNSIRSTTKRSLWGCTSSFVRVVFCVNHSQLSLTAVSQHSATIPGSHDAGPAVGSGLVGDGKELAWEHGCRCVLHHHRQGPTVTFKMFDPYHQAATSGEVRGTHRDCVDVAEEASHSRGQRKPAATADVNMEPFS